MTEGQTPQTAQALDQGSLHHKTAHPVSPKNAGLIPPFCQSIVILHSHPNLGPGEANSRNILQLVFGK
jgi:hypothetical protein